MFDSAIFQAIHHRDQFLNLNRAIAAQKNVFVGSCQQRLPDALVKHVHADGFVTEQDSLSPAYIADRASLTQFFDDIIGLMMPGGTLP